MRLSYLLASLLCALAFGCGDDDGGGSSSMGDGGGPSGSNVAACMRYLSTVNELPCLSGANLPASTCPASLDDLGCDASDVYDCLTRETRCMDVGGVSVIDNAGVTSCGTPTCN